MLIVWAAENSNRFCQHRGCEDNYDFLRERKKQHERRELRDVLRNKNHMIVFELHELKMQ